MSDERFNLPSASGAEIWMNCPAQPAFIKSIQISDNEEQDESTLSGKKIHEALRIESSESLSSDESDTYELEIKNQDDLITQWMRHKGISAIKEGMREERFYLRDQNGEILTS